MFNSLITVRETRGWNILPSPVNSAIPQRVINHLLRYLDSLGISGESFAHAFGAAVGGFIGVVMFFGVRLILEIIRSRPRTIREYMCVTPLNRGGRTEMQGELEHHRGKVLSDRQELKKLCGSRGMGVVKGQNTRDFVRAPILWPYSMDPTEPGLYAVSFRIRGYGFQKPQEISKNWDILMLDVFRTLDRDRACARW